jgi:NAD(P)-dependent dehydrogenase (short-subunit alcohol dehydrogenase family)
MRMCQLVLPGMRAARHGRIVNVSSMGGRFTFPGFGVYHATKYAVEALSDALRVEVKGFGIDVVLIEPGLIRTQFGETSNTSLGAGSSADGPYAKFNEALAASTTGAYEEGPMAKLGGGPETVARAIERAISRKRPRARYLVTPSARVMVTTRALLPDRAWDAAMGSQLPRPGR